MDSELSAAMEKEIGPVNAGYISELQKMATHKEKMIRLNHAITQLKHFSGEDSCSHWIPEQSLCSAWAAGKIPNTGLIMYYCPALRKMMCCCLQKYSKRRKFIEQATLYV